MKFRLLAAFLVLLFSITTASAMNYYIDADTTNGYVWINDSLDAGINSTYYIEKTTGYAPNGEAVFVFFENFSDDLSQWTLTQASVGSATIESEELRITDGAGTDWSTPIKLTHSLPTPATDGYYIQGKMKANPFNYGSLYFGFGEKSNTGSLTFRIDHTPQTIIYHGPSQNNIGTPTSNVFDTYQLWYDGTNYNYNIVTQAASGSFSDSTKPTDIVITADEAGTPLIGYLDDIYVCNYAATEPTVSVTDQGAYYEVRVNTSSSLQNYQVAIPCSDLAISSTTESLFIQKIQDPSIIPTLTDPLNNTYTNSSILSFNITGIGDFNATVFVDDINVWSENVSTGGNQINASLLDGFHSWYVNASAAYGDNTTYNISETWYFTYDSINPTTSIIDVNPDSSNIANGTVVQTNIKWTDANLDYAQFYVDTGSGYTIEDSIVFSSSNQWFNTSIDTTGYTGESISWYQIAYDEAGNSYTYNDSFNVVLNALNIYVYDESSSEQILPSSVVIYNEDLSREAIISESTKAASLSYSNLTTDKYIVSVAADGYYSRRSLLYVDITSLSELNIYLPSENETVIYDTFKIIDSSMLYNYDDMIIRLDKPLANGTETIYSSYLDFAGTTAAYLIATDQYILYIVTPDETINYGWLTPDADGEIDITLNGISIESYYDDWYTYNYTASHGIINLDYISSDDISYASFIVTNSTTELYNVTSLTDSGSFNYIIGTNDTVSVYFELVREDGATFSNFWMVLGSDAEKTVFPESYPQWLKNSVVTALAVLCILGFSSYRIEVGLALGVGIISLAYIWGEYSINASTGYTVFLMAFITIIEFVIQQRKEASR